MSKVNAELSKYGLKLSGKQIIADNKHNDLTLKFIQSLLEKADQAEQQSKLEKPYKARLLMQNASAARKDAERIRNSMKEQYNG